MSQSIADGQCFECSEHFRIDGQIYKRLVYITAEVEVKAIGIPTGESFRYHPISVRVCATCKHKAPPKYIATVMK